MARVKAGAARAAVMATMVFGVAVPVTSRAQVADPWPEEPPAAPAVVPPTSTSTSTSTPPAPATAPPGSSVPPLGGSAPVATPMAVVSVPTATVAPAAPVRSLDEPVVATRSPGLAMAFSLGGTLLPTAGAFLVLRDTRGTAGEFVAAAALASLTAAPSLGHWYAGRRFTLGLGLRLGGLGALLATSLAGCSLAGNEDCSVRAVVGFSGTIAFWVGVVHDIATSAGAAERYNERARKRAVRRLVQPGNATPVLMTSGGELLPGLVVTGGF